MGHKKCLKSVVDNFKLVVNNDIRDTTLIRIRLMYLSFVIFHIISRAFHALGPSATHYK